MRQIVRTAASIVIAAGVVLFAASCDDDDDPTGPGPNLRVYTATLFNTNEFPTATTEDGTGIAVFVDNTTQIDWTMTLDDISAVTMSHIHGPALPSANAGVIFNLYMPAAATGDLNNFTASGSITNTTNANVSLDSLRTLLNNGRAYVNVHTTQFPPGAIRGQLVRTN